MPQPAARAEDGKPLPLFEPGLQHAPPDRPPRTRQRRRAREGDLVGQGDGGSRINPHELGKTPVNMHADMPVDVGAILPKRLGAGAVKAVAAGVQRQTAHDPVPRFEVTDGTPDADDGAGPLVRGGAGKGGAEDARGNHAVGVAVRRDGDFDEEVVGSKRGWDGDGGTLVEDMHDVEAFDVGLGPRRIQPGFKPDRGRRSPCTVPERNMPSYSTELQREVDVAMLSTVTCAAVSNRRCLDSFNQRKTISRCRRHYLGHNMIAQ
ncbi:hypothetical protein CT0861_06998 [Colletotrichum tofieldiae]|uniref:Uncharacterized protein n=1 Tax=Colletotrichum tofieldiae TaxID=708197 RepID=A0A166WEU4_9PEZI|nr:hypothetical protein CT0861_06998 [Colletotrichum tofieldiae]